MIADLVQRVEEDFPTHSLELMDPEVLATFAFAQSLVSHIPPNSTLSADMLTEFLSPSSSSPHSGTSPLVVVGESGVGKSTLLADYLLKTYDKQASEESSESAPPTSDSNPSATKPSAYGKPSSSPPKYGKNSYLSSSPSKSPLGSTPPKANLHSSLSAKTPSPRKLGRSSENSLLATKSPGPNLDLPTNGHNHESSIKKKKEQEVVVIPHFIGCYPTSTNRYEILRKIILTLQKKLHIFVLCYFQYIFFDFCC